VPNEPRETLQPGDLCVIIDHPCPWPQARKYIGLTVVLIETWSPMEPSELTPYWRCSGLPMGVIVSHQVLRKIPPDRMLDARMHDEPVADKNDQELPV